MRMTNYIWIRITGIILLSLFSLTLSAQKLRIRWADIPAGTFMMGSPESEPDKEDDEPQHQVTVNAFRISIYEITFKQYDMFCKATGRKLASDEGWGRKRRPVVNVSWDDAKAFADWARCRLPTEAEWEYAARARTITPFSTGSCPSANKINFDGTKPYTDCSKGIFRKKTTPIGTFDSNGWDLHDMHGNVFEWCSDYYGPLSGETQIDPKGPSMGAFHVIRGGSWNSEGAHCRSAHRTFSRDLSNNTGFRVVTTTNKK